MNKYLTHSTLCFSAGSLPAIQLEQLPEPGDPQLQEWQHCCEQQNAVWKTSSSRGYQYHLPDPGRLCQHCISDHEPGH